MKKILVFGGTFNPIHLGHTRLYRYFADKLGADRVLLIPAKIPPHKRPAELASGEQRMEMCRLAVAEDPRAEACDIELRREAVSYTADTLRQLHEEEPEAELYLVVGSDMLLTLDQWREPEVIMQLAAVCALARHEDEYQALLQKQGQLEARFGGRFLIDNAQVLEISSTQVRQRVKRGESLEGWVPEAVARYIGEQRLYRPASPYPVEETQALLRRRLDERRYEHSLNVADTAEALARIFGEDPEKAYYTGLIHDICKDEPKEQQLQRIIDSAIIWDDKALKQPSLWHAMTGSIFIQQELKITDEDMINAVRYHTTARAGMSPLEKIVYLADLISADRNYPDVEMMRALARASLDKAMAYALQYIIGDLVTHKTQLVDDTVGAYNEYVA